MLLSVYAKRCNDYSVPHKKRNEGWGGKAGKVKSRKQAIAIGLSKARKKGKKVPKKK